MEGLIFGILRYISTHIMLFYSIKQYVIILSTSFFQFNSLTATVLT